MNLDQRVWAMGAQPIGAPGWPELAACTWSALRQRICTAHGGLAACVHSRPKVADKAGHKRGLPSKSPADFFRFRQGGKKCGRRVSACARAFGDAMGCTHRVHAFGVEVDLLLLGLRHRGGRGEVGEDDGTYTDRETNSQPHTPSRASAVSD